MAVTGCMFSCTSHNYANILALWGRTASNNMMRLAVHVPGQYRKPQAAYNQVLAILALISEHSVPSKIFTNMNGEAL